jgi:peptide/nickel transport system substrate-binding protein
MVGISDVDYMDYDTGYYTTDYQVARLTVRQLYGFPADPAKTTTPVPDLATALPVISDNGMKQTVTLRSGVMWNTNPPRPVTVADVVRGIKRVQPEPGLLRRHGGLRGHDQGPERVLRRLPGKGGL